MPPPSNCLKCVQSEVKRLRTDEASWLRCRLLPQHESVLAICMDGYERRCVTPPAWCPLKRAEQAERGG